VKEEVMEILLNVRGIRIASSSERPGKLRLELSGEGRVCAGDIATSADFKIVNPDLHLLTLDDSDSSIYIEFNVEHGKGYQYSENEDGLPVGVLPVDAIFSPVRKVNYSVEMTRVGQTTDYERLILEIWTDGSITPVKSLKKASELLIDHFFLCSNADNDPERDENAVTLSGGVSIEIRQTPIEKLDLSPRTYNCLKRAHIDKVGEVLEKSKSDLLEIRNFGTKSMSELQDKLQEIGILPQNKDNEVDADGEVSNPNGQTEE
jgi:DNA-directed RNA polymerase subunit alpha